MAFLFCLPGPVVSIIIHLFSTLKGSWLYWGDEGSRRERKSGSYIFFFHLTDILNLLVHCYNKGNRRFVFDNGGQRESALLIK